MKKKLLFALSITVICLLSSCSFTIPSDSSSNDTTSNTTSDNITSNSTNDSTSNTTSNDIITEDTSTPTTEDTTIESSEEEFDESKYKKYIFSTPAQCGSYNTGNFNEIKYNNISFGIYRGVKSKYNNKDLLIKLLPGPTTFPLGAIDGSFYNIGKIEGVRRITISYFTSDSYGESPSVSYGNNLHTEEIKSFKNSKTLTTVDIDIPSSSFIKIQSGDNELSIASMTIYYGDTFKVTEVEDDLNDGLYRINPITYEGKLESGVSYVDVPTYIKKNGSSYEVLDTKRYTYYSFDYVKENEEYIDDATMTKPEDVAAYYAAFEEFPVNYVFKNEYKSAYKYFENDTRCVSQYSRADGYVTSVPANQNGDFIYYEFDLVADYKYSSSSRGVYRLVSFKNGFKSEGYDSSPIAVFTDDHYGLFAEYLNYGSSFGERFESELTYNGRSFKAAKTLIK